MYCQYILFLNSLRFLKKTLAISMKVGYNGLNGFQKEGDIMHKYMRTIGFSQYTSRQIWISFKKACKGRFQI